MLEAIRNFFRDRRNAKCVQIVLAAFYGEKIMSRFVAKDVRREIKVANVDEIDSGFIVAQIRTNNILYTRSHFVPEQVFGEPQRVALDRMWQWTGQSWGGLPGGTSIVDEVQSQ